MVNVVCDMGLIRVQASREVMLRPIQGYKELARANTKVYYEKESNNVHVKYRYPPHHPNWGGIHQWYVSADHVKWID